MKRLEEIKNEVAKEFGYSDFHNSTFCRKTDVKICDEIAKRYAREVAQASLEKAAKQAKTFKSGNSGSWLDASIKKESITNEQNITLL
ncbi:hypothetical protein KRE43_12790 [Elizabethkingia meningoseptica]|uniref:hypothetical protein n=1 Tax=Elizabethkingia meningoseptica TaxID=238 RepID=UPI0023AFEB50|nr:hypothetical protein [Elizabethkingia meningoseptica]MDE5530445.1 hypothetical protein [Elizabethkingia meningoseptica]MDE5534002.1 hypothetical protein [Elizabethkingia meningoseptica]MDE5542722.1 hypothetical protein [Elizabethkingia meningoseptica]